MYDLMGSFVTNDTANGTIVGCIVGCRVKKRMVALRLRCKGIAITAQRHCGYGVKALRYHFPPFYNRDPLGLQKQTEGVFVQFLSYRKKLLYGSAIIMVTRFLSFSENGCTRAPLLSLVMRLALIPLSLRALTTEAARRAAIRSLMVLLPVPASA